MFMVTIRFISRYLSFAIQCIDVSIIAIFPQVESRTSKKPDKASLSNIYFSKRANGTLFT